MSLAVLLKQVWDGLARALLDLLIQVDPGVPRSGGDVARDGALAGGHEAIDHERAPHGFSYNETPVQRDEKRRQRRVC
jgi:hypothetical protein